MGRRLAGSEFHPRNNRIISPTIVALRSASRKPRRSTAYWMVRPAAAAGSIDAEKRANGSLDNWPMIMFCGLPTSVPTLPMFALMASASR